MAGLGAPGARPAHGSLVVVALVAVPAALAVRERKFELRCAGRHLKRRARPPMAPAQASMDLEVQRTCGLFNFILNQVPTVGGHDAGGPS